MKLLITIFTLLLAFSASATADENENRQIVLRALSEMFDAQNVELIDELYHPDYIQHSPNIKDGRDGIREGVTWMKENGIRVQREIARVLVQGDLVGVQARVSFGEDWAIVGDIFRLKDGLIVEHWDTTQTEVSQNQTANGHSMIDGGGDTELEISEADLTRNTQYAIEFFAKGIAGDVETLKQLFGSEYIQHNPNVQNGADAIFAFFKDSDGTLSNVTVHETISDGDLTMALVEYADWGNGVIEIVRHDKQGKIVEHWDIVQKIPAADEFAHTNGMF